MTAIISAALTILLSAQLMAQNPSDERIWTGTNGASFRGTYIRSTELGGKVEFFAATGKVVVVAFGNLSKKDQEVIQKFEGRGAVAAVMKTDPDAFKILPNADRGLIPELKPEDHRGTDEDSLVDAIWVSMMWWDSHLVVPIPKTGDFEKKAEWLHKELTRCMAQGGGATGLSDAVSGMNDYFEKKLKDIGACKATVVAEELNPMSLSKLARGNDIAVIKMTMTYDNGRDFSLAAALEKVDEDGTFALHVFGNRFTGKMVTDPKEEKTVGGNKKYELVFNDRLEIPEHYLESGCRFYLNKSSWDGAMLVKPYIYTTVGKPAPLPK